MEKTFEKINEQVLMNEDKARTIAGFLFSQFPYISSMSICTGVVDDVKATETFESNVDIKSVGEFPMPWEVEV